MNLGDVVIRAGRLFGDKVAVVDGDRSITFKELDERSNRFAHLMANHGIKPGDSVAMLVGNSLEWFDATFGLMKAGLIRTYVNPRHTATEVEFQVSDCGAQAIIVTPEFVSMLKGADLSNVAHVIEVGPAYEAALEDCDPHHPMVDVPGDHPLEYRYTSGTTGRPKGAVHSHDGWRTLGLGQIAHMGLRDDDVILHVGPLSHGSGGIGLPMVMVGGKQIVHRGFDPVDVVEAIPRHGITTIVLVPTMIYMLLDLVAERGIDSTSLRTILYGAAPISPQRLERCLEIIGPVFMQTFGMSEVMGGVTFLEKADHVPGSEKLTSCGRPSLFTQLMIADEDGNEVAPGEIGEICLRGPTRLLSYLNRPEATAAAITADGWYKSGDMARMDEQGYVYIVDRKADMIISGGFNVYPAEVEHAIMDHPAVSEVAVVAVPDDKWGELVKAVVRLRPGMEVTQDELLAWLKTHVAGYKTPRSIDFVQEELPKNPTGKILRRQIREPYWAGRSRKVG